MSSDYTTGASHISGMPGSDVLSVAIFLQLHKFAANPQGDSSPNLIAF
jgi:hypothetical protein